jgi:3-hydroxyisobutyrate dehydrogenase
MTTKETVAVLGAGGTMGFPMARNLARAGFEVRASDRSRGKAEPLAQDGALVFDTAADAAAGASVILTMVTDADAVIESCRSCAPSASDSPRAPASTATRT